MKRTYETPNAEKISFCYQEQVAASSPSVEPCISVWVNSGDNSCTSGNSYLKPYNNV